MKTDTEKLIMKSPIAAAYSGLSDETIQRKIRERLAELLKENETRDKMLARHLYRTILPAIAVHGVFLENGYGKNESYTLIRAAALAYCEPRARSIQNFARRIPFFFLLLRFACAKLMKGGFGESGWNFIWKRNDKEALEWDCDRCYFVDVFRAYKMPELIRIFCECDDVMYGNIPGVRWGRTKTIGRGAAICDFKFYKEK